MQKLIILALLFLMPACLPAQNITYRFGYGKGAITWAGIEKKVPRAVVTKCINSLPGEFGAYRKKEEYSPTLNDLYGKLHFMDLNGDGNNDVIFEGQSGGEPQEVEIYMFTNGRYVKVLEEYEGVLLMTFKNNRLVKIVVSNWGCCDDYINFDKTFDVSINKEGALHFTLVLQTASAFQGTLPDSLFETPVAFEVLNDACKLRSRPVLDDTSYEPWNEADSVRGTGNTLARLPQGARGLALGKHTDDTGREWWYAEFDENIDLIKSAF
ncbi:MAG TPA: hypothetical protein VHB48_08990, partial [Chitinophagaceae bacterium]|nr:hypothetical protein [Chitinophagaceae bacterium]